VLYRFTIKGTVQGVGFRPYVYNACVERGLVGSVQNTGEAVEVLVNDKDALIEILAKIPTNARVDSYEIEEVAGNATSFIIKESAGEGYSEIPPDFFLCDDCFRDMRDPENRRFGYFFTTCTNCGPRFTTTIATPYDRHTTTMREFPMCVECKNEYEDPTNRRYHSQTIACHGCGPRLALYDKGVGISKDDTDALLQAAELLKQGEIVAIKGIGGFHLACTTEPDTILKLRELRDRPHKPFALMCRDLEMVMSIAVPNDAQKEALTSPERPIVLVPKRKGLEGVTELDSIGIMLPYSALHYLLFEHLDIPLVMTSSNASDEPMSKTREEQIGRYVLDHSRAIANAADDSVVKFIAGRRFFIRRSRGFVPQSLPIPKGGKTILAMGAEMNNTSCITKPDGRAILSQHMGNTANVNSFERYKETIETFLRFTDSTPDVIVTDLHPTYNTSVHGAFLSEQFSIPLEKVQHHRAHAYSVALEHGLDDFVAIIADGLGYGEDGTIWGGEIFHNDERVGHLEQHLQLGGDSATRHPAKMLFSILRNFLSLDEVAPYIQNFYAPGALALLDKQWTDKFNAPLTSSCGRVLDAAAFLLGFCDERTYDGRPAMLLEANSFGPLKLEPIIKDNVLMTTPLFEFLVRNMDKDKKRLAATVQRYLAEGLYEIAKQYNKPIVWSGGCAYNTLMTGFMLEQGVLTNREVPPGDGGISFGQVAYYLHHSQTP
jgi:hydrogenase maturation protein HypF